VASTRYRCGWAGGWQEALARARGFWSGRWDSNPITPQPVSEFAVRWHPVAATAAITMDGAQPGGLYEPDADLPEPDGLAG